MTDSDLTVTILREIRDEIRTTNTRLASLEATTDTRLTSLEAATQETNVRLGVIEHTLQGVAAELVIVGRFTKNVTTRHGKAIDDLRERVTKLERRNKS